ncbi:hypothetical protein [Deinococcus misasensis]|uniref:hypothetical protein n=1 Tax=Deinococcus misasensis TaxID=392413 RepID=UPI0005563E85|nr:hypothetical protein [Deinococcus misasensis]
MKINAVHVLSVLSVGLASCGVQPTPRPTESPDTRVEEMATAPTCSAFTRFGAGWNQSFTLSDGATPYNYHAYTTVLPQTTDMQLVPYPINAAGTTSVPSPLHYDYFYRPTLTLAGVPEGGGATTNVYINTYALVGLAYLNDVKMFDLRVRNAAEDLRTINDAGTVSSVVTRGDRWTFFPSKRFKPGAVLKVETFLKGNITYKNEMVLANYQGQGSNPKKWFKVAMPHQDLVVRINTDPYNLEGNPNPIQTFVVPVRGFNNAADPSHAFWFRNELYYDAPYDATAGKSIPQGTSAFNSWLESRQDHVLNWSVFDQKIGKVTVDANNNPSAPTEVKNLQDWNLGTPSTTNQLNCISKTTTVYNDQRRFDHIMPASVVNAPKLAGPSVTSGTARTVTSPDTKISETRATTSFVLKNSGTQPLTYSWGSGHDLILSDENLSKTLAPGTSRTVTVSGRCPIDPATGKPLLLNYSQQLRLYTNDPRQTAGANWIFGSGINIKVICAATTLYGWSNGTQTYVNVDFPAEGQSGGPQASSNPLADFQSKLTTDLAFSNPREVNPAGGSGTCQSQLSQATNATRCFWADVEANPAFEASNEVARTCARALGTAAAIWKIDNPTSTGYPSVVSLYGDSSKAAQYGTGVCSDYNLVLTGAPVNSGSYNYAVGHRYGNITYTVTEQGITPGYTPPNAAALACAQNLVRAAAIWKIDNFFSTGYPAASVLTASPELYGTHACQNDQLTVAGEAVSSGSFTYLVKHGQGTRLYTATESGVAESNLP